MNKATCISNMRNIMPFLKKSKNDNNHKLFKKVKIGLIKRKRNKNEKGDVI